MLYSTRGIVLHYMKYKETSIIVKIFTEKLGKQSFLIPEVRAPNARHASALFQLLVPLELEMDYRQNTSLQRVIEVKQHFPVTAMVSDIHKTAIITFLAELLNKTLYEELQNAALFDFLLQSIVDLNKLQTGYEAFYLGFMLRLCAFLGFGCTHALEINMQLRRAGHQQCFSVEEMSFLNHLLQATTPDTTSLPKASHSNMLMGVLRYMQLHVDHLHTLKSLSVLQALSQ